MGQFIFGLSAGIVVGLVMEWVIDWTGLLPKRSVSKGNAQKSVPSMATSDANRVEEPARTEAASSPSNPEINEE